MSKINNIWVIIPAAGVGHRMASNIPKQYLPLGNKTVIEHTLDIFFNCDAVSEIVVVISAEDEYWPALKITSSKSVQCVHGGKERCDSVLNGLRLLQDKAAADDWILVHDAARPCLRNEDLTLLLEKLSQHDVGGILAVPVRDTMKRSMKNVKQTLGKISAIAVEALVTKQILPVISTTVERERLWHALTPQMFRYALLKQALEEALIKNKQITDEASALEFAGYAPALLEGHADNVKITRPEDLSLAAFYLQQQERM